MGGSVLQTPECLDGGRRAGENAQRSGVAEKPACPQQGGGENRRRAGGQRLGG